MGHTALTANPCTRTSLASVSGHDLTCPKCRADRLRGLNAILPRLGDFSLPYFRPPMFQYSALAPDKGAQRLSRLGSCRDTGFQSTIGTGSYGVLHCPQCLATRLEHSADLPPIYEWFGYERCIRPRHLSNLTVFAFGNRVKVLPCLMQILLTPRPTIR